MTLTGSRGRFGGFRRRLEVDRKEWMAGIAEHEQVIDGDRDGPGGQCFDEHLREMTGPDGRVKLGSPLASIGAEFGGVDLEAELDALGKLTDEQIITFDIAEQVDWAGAKRGVFYQSIKQPLTLRIDSDVIAWFKARVADGEGYQTRINSARRAYVEQQEGK